MTLKDFVDTFKIIKNITLTIMFVLVISVTISLYFQPSFMQINPSKFNDFMELTTSKYNINNIHNIMSPEQVEEIAKEINQTCYSEECPYNKTICYSEMCYIYEVNLIMQDFTYVNDMSKYIFRDYWQSPAVTIAFGLEGDCEDSAIFQDSILNNLMNETYLIHSNAHIYNLVCVNEIPVVIDFSDLYIGKEAINRIEEYAPIKYYNYRKNKWSKDFDGIAC